MQLIVELVLFQLLLKYGLNMALRAIIAMHREVVHLDKKKWETKMRKRDVLSHREQKMRGERRR